MHIAPLAPKPAKLTTLDMRDHTIFSFPVNKVAQEGVKLGRLYMDDNKLSELPYSTPDGTWTNTCPYLERLTLSNNQIVSIPRGSQTYHHLTSSELGNFSYLKVLNLSRWIYDTLILIIE